MQRTGADTCPQSPGLFIHKALCRSHDACVYGSDVGEPVSWAWELDAIPISYPDSSKLISVCVFLWCYLRTVSYMEELALVLRKDRWLWTIQTPQVLPHRGYYLCQIVWGETNLLKNQSLFRSLPYTTSLAPSNSSSMFVLFLPQDSEMCFVHSSVLNIR